MVVSVELTTRSVSGTAGTDAWVAKPTGGLNGVSPKQLADCEPQRGQSEQAAAGRQGGQPLGSQGGRRSR